MGRECTKREGRRHVFFEKAVKMRTVKTENFLKHFFVFGRWSLIFKFPITFISNYQYSVLVQANSTVTISTLKKASETQLKHIFSQNSKHSKHICPKSLIDNVVTKLHISS